MENNELSPDEYIDIAEKVRSGEYFRDSRTMVDIDIHDPMADRYWYIAVTTMSIFITLLAYTSPEAVTNSKIAILIASFTAGTIGFLWLKFTLKMVPENEI